MISLGFASLIETFHLSTHENILTIALINIHFLYNIVYKHTYHRQCFTSSYLTSSFHESNERFDSDRIPSLKLTTKFEL